MTCEVSFVYLIEKNFILESVKRSVTFYGTTRTATATATATVTTKLATRTTCCYYLLLLLIIIISILLIILI